MNRHVPGQLGQQRSLAPEERQVRLEHAVIQRVRDRHQNPLRPSAPEVGVTNGTR